MINFQLNNKQYSIRFFYENADDLNDPNPLANVCGKRIKTTCKISERTNEGKYEDVAVGTSVNHKSDIFTKDAGRKLAMARALQISNRQERLVNYDMRKSMWTKYFEHHKEGQKLINAGKVSV